MIERDEVSFLLSYKSILVLSDPCASLVSSGRRVLFSYDEVFFVVPTTGDVRCVLARDAVCSTFFFDCIVSYST